MLGLLALIALALAIYNVAARPTNGRLGLRLQWRSGAVHALVRPNGPAAQAGIRNGDTIAYGTTPLASRIAAAFYPRAHQSYPFAIIRGGERNVVNVTAIVDTESSPYGVIADLVLAFVYVTLCFIVIARAPPSILSTALEWMLVLQALINSTTDFQYTAPNVFLSYFVGLVAQTLFAFAFYTLVVYAVGSFANPEVALRTRFARLAPALAFPMLGDYLVPALAVPLPVVSMPAVSNALYSVTIVYGLAVGAFLLVLPRKVPPAERLRLRWFVSTIALCAYITFSLYTLNDAFIGDSGIRTVLTYVIAFALVGPVYATLRHSLIDIDLVISRSTVYAALSIVVVTAFLSAEWLTNTVGYQIFGRGRWSATVAQLISFFIAICVGLGMRSLHVRVESLVNGILFRDRDRKLRLLQDLGRAADAADSRAELIALTIERVREALESEDGALYVRDGSSFVCKQAFGVRAPDRLSSSEPALDAILLERAPGVLKTGAWRGWLAVPLAVRMEIVGLIFCGPKHDRTEYSPDELCALDAAAHRIGTSHALLATTVTGEAEQPSQPAYSID